jgi:peptidyl-prolyl cis-trans isomerase SurA
MRLARSKAMWRWMLGAVVLVALPVSLLSVRSSAQVARPAGGGAVAEPAAGSGQGVVVDRMIAIVNSDVILESDVDEERRFEEIQPYRMMGEFTRERAVERLIDRALILQQAALEPEDVVTDSELDAQMLTLRRDIPACKQYHCESEAGWKKYVEDHGFTEEEFRDRWRKRMQLLKFIEVRFRNGIKISDDEIKSYYEKTMLPEYTKRSVTPPPLETISKRIEEVLLQQEVGALLEDWLKSLRAQGRVRVLTERGAP